MKNTTICPKCGYKRTEDDNEHMSLEECPSCGIIYKKIKQIPPQQVVESIESISIVDRVLCGDGCCIGIIGKNGLCTECGKSPEETSSHSVNIEEQNECKEKLINCEVCKKDISINATSCPHCGEPKIQKEQNTPSSFNSAPLDKKNKTVAALLALFIGTIGMHRFYIQRAGSGFLYLGSTVLGVALAVDGNPFPWLIIIPGCCAFIEAVNFFLMSEKDFDNKYRDKQTYQYL